MRNRKNQPAPCHNAACGLAALGRALADEPPVAPGLKGHWARLAGRLGRFHADQEGAMLDYVMVLAVLIPMVIFLFVKMFQVLADYFGMIAFYASWPFL